MAEDLTTYCRNAICVETNPGNNAVCLGYYACNGKRGEALGHGHSGVVINDRIFVYRCNICTWLFGLAEPNHVVLMYQHKRLEDQQDDLGVFNSI